MRLRLSALVTLVLLPITIWAGPRNVTAVSKKRTSSEACSLALTNEKKLNSLLVNNPNVMNKNRGLKIYAEESFEGAPFMKIVKNLPDDFLIIENGPGLARAAIDLMNNPKLSKNGRVLLIDKVKPEDEVLEAELKRHKGSLQYVAGETLEERCLDGSLDDYIGAADGAWGSFSGETYGTNLKTTLECTLRLLKAGGRHVFNVQWMDTSNMANPKINTTFRPQNRQGENGDDYDIPEKTFHAWLKQIRGAEVEYFGEGGGTLTYWVVVLKRTTGPINVPPLITKAYKTKYSPPLRTFIAPTVTVED